MPKANTFKRLTDEQVLKAIGLAKGGADCNDYDYVDLFPQFSAETCTPWEYFLPNSELFQPIRLPGDGDWLACHSEKGQGFREFRNAKRNHLDQIRNKIYIQPCMFYQKTGIPRQFLQTLATYAQIFFNTPVEVDLDFVSLDPLIKSIGRRTNPVTANNQVNAEDILKNMAMRLPKDAFCLAAITLTDIYPCDEWNFVFGLASSSRRCGIYSLSRYVPTFPNDNIDRSVFSSPSFLRLAINIMCHEIGHMFGLEHCIYFECLMNGRNNQVEEERGTGILCPVCLRKLLAACKFDVYSRFQSLCEFSKNNNLKEDARWYESWLISNTKGLK